MYISITASFVSFNGFAPFQVYLTFLLQTRCQTMYAVSMNSLVPGQLQRHFAKSTCISPIDSCVELKPPRLYVYIKLIKLVFYFFLIGAVPILICASVVKSALLQECQQLSYPFCRQRHSRLSNLTMFSHSDTSHIKSTIISYSIQKIINNIKKRIILLLYCSHNNRVYFEIKTTSQIYGSMKESCKLVAQQKNRRKKNSYFLKLFSHIIVFNVYTLIYFIVFQLHQNYNTSTFFDSHKPVTVECLTDLNAKLRFIDQMITASKPFIDNGLSLTIAATI